MSRRRNRNTNKANNSNLVGLVATVTNAENVNVGKRVAIQEVNNDIAKVFLLDDKKMNKFKVKPNNNPLLNVGSNNK